MEGRRLPRHAAECRQCRTVRRERTDQANLSGMDTRRNAEEKPSQVAVFNWKAKGPTTKVWILTPKTDDDEWHVQNFQLLEASDAGTIKRGFSRQLAKDSSAAFRAPVTLQKEMSPIFNSIHPASKCSASKSNANWMNRQSSTMDMFIRFPNIVGRRCCRTMNLNR